MVEDGDVVMLCGTKLRNTSMKVVAMIGSLFCPLPAWRQGGEAGMPLEQEHGSCRLSARTYGGNWEEHGNRVMVMVMVVVAHTWKGLV